MPASTALKAHEFGAGESRDQPRQRGFAAAWWSPEEHRAEIVVFDLHAERLAGAEEFFLADEFVERARTHALGERLMRERNIRLFGSRQLVEEAHGLALPLVGWRFRRWRAAS